jgi:hypothetical protein
LKKIKLLTIGPIHANGIHRSDASAKDEIMPERRP